MPRNLSVARPLVPACTLVHLIERDFLSPETKKPIKLMPHQRQILNFILTPRNNQLLYNTAIYSTPKKEGKTETAAMLMYGWAKTYGGDIYSIANDLTQAQERAFMRVVDMLRTVKMVDPQRFAAEIHPDYHRTIAKKNRDGNYQVVFNNPQRPTRILAIPCDPYGEAGGMQSLTIWDELWGMRTDAALRLWGEMQPLPRGMGGVEESLRFIVTYAGWFGESHLLWSLYEQVCQPDEQMTHEAGDRVHALKPLPVYHKDRIIAYWDHENRAPWKTKTFLEEARRDPVVMANPSEYARLWENRWTTGLDPFIDMNALGACVERFASLGLTRHDLEAEIAAEQFVWSH